MRGLYDACRSPRGRLVLNVGVGVFAIMVSILAARHFAGVGWPFSGANVGLVAAAGVLFLLAFAFKAYGWHRLFAPHERPKPLTLGAACGGRQRHRRRPAGPLRRRRPRRGRPRARRMAVPASVPSASPSSCSVSSTRRRSRRSRRAAAVTADAGTRSPGRPRVVAFAGFGAAVVIAVLPRLTASGRLIRFRIARWLGERVIAPRDAWQAWVLVLASWLTRRSVSFSCSTRWASRSRFRWRSPSSARRRLGALSRSPRPAPPPRRVRAQRS